MYDPAVRGARLALDNGHPFTALLLARRHVERHGATPLLCHLQGNALAQMGRYTEARQAYLDARFLVSDDPTAFAVLDVCLGHLHLNVRNRAEAEACYRRALAHPEPYLAALVHLGELLGSVGRNDEAEELLLDATVRTEPRWQQPAWLCLGQLWQRDDDRLADAEDAFREALLLDPSCEDAGRGLRDIRQALSLSDTRPTPEMVRATNMVEQPATTRMLASRYLEADPGDAIVRCRLASVWADLGRPDLARTESVASLEHADDALFALAWRLTGRVCAQLGDVEEADYWLDLASNARPDFANSHIFRGAMYARLGALEDAEACLRRATGCRDGCIDEAWLNLGNVLRAQERLEEASFCMQAALDLSNDYPAASTALADLDRAMSIRDGSTKRGRRQRSAPGKF